jgi:hypothetical protein
VAKPIVCHLLYAYACRNTSYHYSQIDNVISEKNLGGVALLSDKAKDERLRLPSETQEERLGRVFKRKLIKCPPVIMNR